MERRGQRVRKQRVARYAIFGMGFGNELPETMG